MRRITAIQIFTLIASVSLSSATDRITEFARTKTLYIAGWQWDTPNTFNPLHDSPIQLLTGQVMLVYETLFGYDMLSGELKPLLGKAYTIRDNLVMVDLHPQARWSDGSQVTADDVVHTFYLHKYFPTSSQSDTRYWDSVWSQGPTRAVIRMNEKNLNRLKMKDILTTVYILPRKVFADREEMCRRELGIRSGYGDRAQDARVYQKLVEWRNDSTPVVSGPYTLYHYNNEKIVLRRNDAYWGTILYGGRRPGPEFIVHPIYRSNDKYNLLFTQGMIDVTQDFIPRIWTHFKKGVGTWSKNKPYYLPGTIVALLVNHTRQPFSDSRFRQAMARAIDYEKIRTISIYGYAPPLQPGCILPVGPEARYVNKDDCARLGVRFDPEASRRMFVEAGYGWDKQGFLTDKRGVRLPAVYITCPSGWTDWETAIKITVEGLRSVGLDVRERFIEWDIWWQELCAGTFDLTLRSPLDWQCPSLPFGRFEWVMSSAGIEPVGTSIYRNEGRFRNRRADSLLIAVSRLTDENEIGAVYEELNRIFMQELPVIPLMYRPWLFYAFNSSTWKNFPTEENPIAPPMALFVGGGMAGLFHIEAR